MKLGPVTKPDKRNKTTSKNLTLTSCQKIVTSFSFFGFLANLEQSGGRTPDAESAKVMFFKISGQSLIKESCHNSRVSDHIDMKLGPVTKPDKRNKATSKKFDVEVMSKNCDVIFIFRIFGRFGAIWRPESRRRVRKSPVFSNSNLLPYRN